MSKWTTFSSSLILVFWAYWWSTHGAWYTRSHLFKKADCTSRAQLKSRWRAAWRLARLWTLLWRPVLLVSLLTRVKLVRHYGISWLWTFSMFICHRVFPGSIARRKAGASTIPCRCVLFISQEYAYLVIWGGKCHKELLIIWVLTHRYLQMVTICSDSVDIFTLTIEDCITVRADHE